MSNVIAGPALVRGIKNNFINTYKSTYDGIEATIGQWIDLGIPSDNISTLFGYFESAPHPRRRDWGDPVEQEGFRARNFSIEQFSWDVAVTWLRYQRKFDLLQDLENQASQAGANFAFLPERLMFQFITDNTTDDDLLPRLPNLPDGAALFSGTDGDGNDRNGVSGGNLIDGAASTGIASSDAIRDDYFTGLRRFVEFQDKKGQPFIDPGLVSRNGVTIFHAPEHNKVFAEAFVQARTIEGSNTPSNIILDAGKRVELVETQRLTGDDWFMFLNNPPTKPFAQIMGEALQVEEQLTSNSDRGRSIKEEGVFFSQIGSLGVTQGAGFFTLKIDN